jgi:hypothetical protein
MSDTIPTVRVKSGDSYAIINESDFDPSVHELFEAPPAPPPPPPGAPPPPPGPTDPLDGLAENWRDDHGARLKSIAQAVSQRAVENKAQAIEVIEQALADRAAK